MIITITHFTKFYFTLCSNTTITTIHHHHLLPTMTFYHGWLKVWIDEDGHDWWWNMMTVDDGLWATMNENGLRRSMIEDVTCNMMMGDDDGVWNKTRSLGQSRAFLYNWSIHALLFSKPLLQCHALMCRGGRGERGSDLSALFSGLRFYHEGGARPCV